MFPVDAQAFGIYADIQSLLPSIVAEEPVSVDALNQLKQQLNPALLSRFSFVAQTSDFDWQDQYYEQVIFERGLIPSRIDSWHDIFNACIWLLFPKTKILLNKLHIEDINTFGLTKRNPRRNALTFLDECGVIVASSKNEVIEELRDHQWVTAFWQQRTKWNKQVRAFMFGHGNYETAFAPFIGLTGKMFPVTVDAEFFELSLLAQYHHLDDRIVELIDKEKCLQTNKYLSPLPLLGVPGWFDGNDNIEFYRNTEYFRPKRKQGK